ncbi:MAG: hypothetical protein IKM72_08705, partial [Oscillospiraceae bacterium]|nr:hypothetical protein [Oscillospiraceae bacterium]
KISEISEDFKNPDVTSWAVDAALEEFCDFICEYKNLSYEDGMKEFMGGGYEIYLTIDEDIQNELERNMADLTYFPEEMASYTDDDGNEQWENVDAAAVVMDYFGEIKGFAEESVKNRHHSAGATPQMPAVSRVRPLSRWQLTATE